MAPDPGAPNNLCWQTKGHEQHEGGADQDPGDSGVIHILSIKNGFLVSKMGLEPLSSASSKGGLGFLERGLRLLWR